MNEIFIAESISSRHVTVRVWREMAIGTKEGIVVREMGIKEERGKKEERVKKEERKGWERD